MNRPGNSAQPTQANAYGTEAYWRQLERERQARWLEDQAYWAERRRQGDQIQGEIRTTLALENFPREYR